ncbi:MAG TPA: NADH:flavin oxidoreductase [Gaiellaceae bacterium]|nr:NADH:flavin oxidoreductase [Gaiellaceae bacterium]
MVETVHTPRTRSTILLEPGRLGPVETRNRIVRSGTSESMGGPGGEVTDELVALHERLARGGTGLIVTGHMYCHPRGRYERMQTGIDRDELIPGLRRLTEAVHRHDGRIFAQIAHAGSQSIVPGNEPLAPSPIPNVMTGRTVREASADEVEEAIAAFGAAARRAVEAGFDGIHVHGANGYLISEFRSPLTNRREDAWGGSQPARDAFPLAVVEAVRAVVPAELGLSMKVGCEDVVDEPGGLTVEDALAGIRAFAAAGLDAIEVSSNLMADYERASIVPYVAVDSRRALQDLLPHRLFKPPADEAYFLPYARRARAVVDAKIILVGGLRRTSTMEAILERGEADFVAMARPLIRQPDLARRIEAGWRGRVDCVSCNICLMHEDHHALRCWRVPRRRLVQHAAYRLRGGFRSGLWQEPSPAPTSERKEPA